MAKTVRLVYGLASEMGMGKRCLQLMQQALWSFTVVQDCVRVRYLESLLEGMACMRAAGLCPHASLNGSIRFVGIVEHLSKGERFSLYKTQQSSVLIDPIPPGCLDVRLYICVVL